MSYEGRVEYLCEVGHRWTQQCDYSMDEEPTPCVFCDKKSVWEHDIDDTNCDAIGFIPDTEWEKLLISPEEVERCNLGHTHVIKHARYRVPTDEEKRSMEHGWDPEIQAYTHLRRSS